MIGGYTWSATVDSGSKVINLDVYLFLSASRTIDLGGGVKATVEMSSEMPGEGKTTWKLDAPEGWTWALHVPRPEYAEDFKVCLPSSLRFSC